jgi:hypothetical protein
MSGPKRNPDSLNTFGVVVVGISGAVMVYVAIAALQAFYMNDTSEIQTMADYGGQDVTAKGHKADEIRNITEPGSNPAAPGATPTYHIKIDHAMELVVDSAKQDPSHLVPALPPSQKATIQPIFGRPKPLAVAPVAPAPAAGSGSAAINMTPTGGATPVGNAQPAALPAAAAPAPNPAAAATGSGGHAP